MTDTKEEERVKLDAETKDHLLIEHESIVVDHLTPKKSAGRPRSRKSKNQKPVALKTPDTKIDENNNNSKSDKGHKNAKKDEIYYYCKTGAPIDIGDEDTPLRKLKTRDYLELIAPLHVELLKFQNWVKESGTMVLGVFEGRDAAGKGGTIKRFIEHLNPRGCRVVALEKPTDRETSQWYFQRYVEHLPAGGEIVLLDRSWYNRAMVERVMGFCSGEDVKEFLRSTPEFERMLIRANIHMVKFYFSVSKKEQARRFNARETDPLKQWKLSPVDRASQFKWDDYTKAKQDMFFYTSTADAPWTIIKSDDKKRARLNAMRFFLAQFHYPGKCDNLLVYDRRIVRTVEQELDVED